MPQQFIQPQRSDETSSQQADQIQTQTAAQPETDVFDSVLDDISTALNENAEEYVSSFVQKGGQ